MKVINEKHMRKPYGTRYWRARIWAPCTFHGYGRALRMAESGKINLSDIQKEIWAERTICRLRDTSHTGKGTRPPRVWIFLSVSSSIWRGLTVCTAEDRAVRVLFPEQVEDNEQSGYTMSTTTIRGRTTMKSAKEIYRKEYKTCHNNEYAGYDEPEHEYCNHAEERLVSDNGFISTAAISRVDVACYDPYGESYDSDEDYGEEIDEAFENFTETDNYMVEETIRQAREILQLKNCHIPLKQGIFLRQRGRLPQADGQLSYASTVHTENCNRIKSSVAESVLMEIVFQAVRKVLNEEETTL